MLIPTGCVTPQNTFLITDSDYHQVLKLISMGRLSVPLQAMDKVMERYIIRSAFLAMTTVFM